MSLSYSHGREFVEQARPIFESDNPEAVARFLRRYWPASDLRALLDCGHDDAASMALVGLSLIGIMEDGAAIAALLHHDDGTMAEFAEHALWSIWFRDGGDEASAALAQAVRLIDEQKLDEATAAISAALASAPDFAEAHHQLAMLGFLRGDYAVAIESCRSALRLNPWHFGAMAGLGHCYAAQGYFNEARMAYQRALELNPRLAGVRQAIRQLRSLSHADEAAPGPVNQFTNL